jgi:hypothetical protein
MIILPIGPPATLTKIRAQNADPGIAAHCRRPEFAATLPEL